MTPARPAAAATRKSASSNPEAIEKRLDTLIERASARAQKQADMELNAADIIRTNSYPARYLVDVEAQIHDLSQDKGDLTPYGRQMLQGLRVRRAGLQEQIALAEEPHRRKANAILSMVTNVQKATRHARGLDASPARLQALLLSLERLQDYFTSVEVATFADLQRAVESLVLATETAAAAAEADSLPVIEPLPPTAWEFEEPAAGAFRDAVAGAAGLRAYRLNRAAQELSLVSGFDVLLTPQIAHGLTEYPHQIETARAVLRRMRGRALLCDEVGLGKTIEAGLIASEYVARGLVRRILVLAPPALVSQWRDEMREKFNLEFITHDDPTFRQHGSDAWEAHDRIIASIHTAKLPAHRAPLLQQEFDLIIVDEAHHLRSRTSQGWKFVNDLKKRYVLLLTATPVQNDLDELFNLITLLSPGQLNTSSAFKREFVVRGDPRTPRNRERLRQLLAEVMVRNTRSQVHIAMPPRIAHTHRVVQSPEEAALYAAVTAFIRQGLLGRSLDRMAAATLLREAGSSAPALASTLENMAGRGRAGTTALRDLAGMARVVRNHAKCDHLRGILARRREKTVVFTFFRETLHLLERALEEAGIGYATLSGELTAAEKERAVASFAADRQVLLSTDVGSEGRNLQFCHAILNFDLPWNPQRIEQRVGRVHRIGQTNEVLIDNLCARQTIEDYILRILDDKLNMFELVVGEVGVILGNLENDQDFEELALDIWAGAGSDAEVERGFDRLGDQVREAQSRHRAAQEYDEALFGNELATPAIEEEG